MSEAVEVAGIECVLLDIEGTICPISFVKETLFPYALKALPDILSTKWQSPEVQPYISAFPTEHTASPETLLAHVQDLTARDVKIASLKNLQGYLWEAGYREGAYATPLFEDVAPCLREWKVGRGKEVAIYSSGSVFAQKLLFGFVRKGVDDEGGMKGEVAGEKRMRKKSEISGVERKRTRLMAKKEAKGKEDRAGGVERGVEAAKDEGSDELADKKPVTEDLSDLISGWFDTTNAGLKLESSSYEKIAKELKYDPKKVLFLSDNVKEVDAAIAAGMKSILVDRPGNVPVSKSDRERLNVVISLKAIGFVDEACQGA